MCGTGILPVEARAALLQQAATVQVMTKQPVRSDYRQAKHLPSTVVAIIAVVIRAAIRGLGRSIRGFDVPRSDGGCQFVLDNLEVFDMGQQVFDTPPVVSAPEGLPPPSRLAL